MNSFYFTVANINYAIRSKRKTIMVPCTRTSKILLRFLYERGFILTYKLLLSRQFLITFHAPKNTQLWTAIKAVSLPTKMKTLKLYNLKKASIKLGFIILSTDKGIIEVIKANQQQVGGKIWCVIYI